MSRNLPLEAVLWAAFATAVLGAIVWALRGERRAFVARGQGRAWWVLRLSSLPIALLCVGGSFLAARTVGGGEGLAVFYGGLLLVTPLAWFALHWAIGRGLGLAAGPSVGVATSGLIYLIAPFVLGSMVHPHIVGLGRAPQPATPAFAADAALPHAADAPLRWRLPGAGEIWTQRLRAPAGVRLIEVAPQPAARARATGAQSILVCRWEGDLQLLWAVEDTPDALRVSWRGSDEVLHRSVFSAQAGTAAAHDFSLAWHEAGVRLPAMLPRSVVFLGRRDGGGELVWQGLNQFQPGETFENDCLPEDYRRVAWQSERPIEALQVTFPRGGSPTRAVLMR